MAKSNGEVLLAYNKRIQDILDSSKNSSLSESCNLLERSTSQLIAFAQRHPDRLEYLARDFAFGLARNLAGALLLEHASWTGAADSDRAAAERWLGQRDLLAQSLNLSQNGQNASQSAQKLDDALVFDGYDKKNILSPLF